MQHIRFDFNNMLSDNIGLANGITEYELKKIKGLAASAHNHLAQLASDEQNRRNLGLEWIRLPFQDKSLLKDIQQLGEEISKNFSSVIFLGIGGSYLGLKAAQDALLPCYYNEFATLRKGAPRFYFEGKNLDPDTLDVLLKNLNPKETFVVVISKSGETTETKAAFCVVEKWLKKGAGKRYGRQVAVITDPKSGSLRKRVIMEQMKDVLSFRSLPLIEGVGGRFSELNMGLLHLAIAGVDIEDLLCGASTMAKRCSNPDLFKNPALMYAAINNILYHRKGKSIAILMPFSEALKSTADWYCQLLAESLGKKYSRKIKVSSQGKESWELDTKKIINVGRTPVSACGTADLHSIHQNNVEGENNKVITFIRVEKFKSEFNLSGTGDFLSGRSFSYLLKLAQEATEWALVKESRPNCSIIMPEVTPYYWGGLIFFFEMATAYEGELLNINAFNQPGVEGYKNYMYFKLDKPGISAKVANEIKSRPLVKKEKFII